MSNYLAALLASMSTWWADVCKKHLIADSPDTVIIREKIKATPEQERWLVELYRQTGAKAYYGDRIAARDLKYIGDELRAYGIGYEAIQDYGRFER